jgi:hypothetical protein
MAIVHTWAARERIVGAAEAAGLTVVTTLPVALRDGKPPHLGLYELARTARPRHERAALVIRDRADVRSAEYSAAREWMGFPP